jgi:hypothetical protein
VIIIVEGDHAGTVWLAEPWNLSALHVELRGRKDALTALGQVDVDGDVHITRESLTQLTRAPADDPRWLAAVDEMLEHARHAGWVDDTGAVRAHVVHASSIYPA